MPFPEQVRLSELKVEIRRLRMEDVFFESLVIDSTCQRNNEVLRPEIRDEVPIEP